MMMSISPTALHLLRPTAGWLSVYIILHRKCARSVFTHELWRIRDRTSERSERVKFLIQNECVNIVQNTFHVGLCLLYTYCDYCLARENLIDQFKWGYSKQFVLIQRALRCLRKSTPQYRSLYCFHGLPFFRFVILFQTVWQINYEVLVQFFRCCDAELLLVMFSLVCKN